MSKNILILEDDVVFRKALSQSLFKKGFSCIETHSIAQALSAIENLDIDLFVIDQGLQNGEEGLDFLRTATEKKIPSILVTAFPSKELSSKAWALGAFEVFQKPVDMDIFVDAISIGCEIGAPSPHLSYQAPPRGEEPGLREVVEFDQLPILQESILDQLTAMVSKPEMAEIQTKFNDQADEDVENIKAALSSKDFLKVAEASHRLAGAMLNLGLLRCEAISRALQHAAKNELSSCQDLLEPLETSKRESLVTLEEAIEKLSA